MRVGLSRGKHLLALGDDKAASLEKGQKRCLGGAALFEKAKPSKSDSSAKNESQNLIIGGGPGSGSKANKDIAFLLA